MPHAPQKDRRGRATPAGQRAFGRREGSHFRPGVKKAVTEMSLDEMRRKGIWAVRVYGRSGPLPRLIDDKGRPTRFALTAVDWGEPIPKTVAAARRIAAKGHRLLTAYKRQMARRKR